MCLDHLRRNDVFWTISRLNTRVHCAINPLSVKIFVKTNSLIHSFTYLLFFVSLFFPGRTGDGGSTSTSDSTRDDAFRSLFSNRLDDFMDSTSSTGDIFPPPLASSRSGQLTAHFFNLMDGPCWKRHCGLKLCFIAYKTTWVKISRVATHRSRAKHVCFGNQLFVCPWMLF